jgi:hypothetical protein
MSLLTAFALGWITKDCHLWLVRKLKARRAGARRARFRH